MDRALYSIEETRARLGGGDCCADQKFHDVHKPTAGGSTVTTADHHPREWRPLRANCKSALISGL